MRDKRKREKDAKNSPSKSVELVKIPFLDPEAVDLYFNLAARGEPVTIEEIRGSVGGDPGQVEKVIVQLVERGLIRRIATEDGYEAIAPVEAVAAQLEVLRGAVQELREQLPHQLEEALKLLEKNLQQQRIAELSTLAPELGITISSAIREALGAFHAQAEELRGAPAFEAFAEELRSNLMREVEQRMAQVRSMTKCHSLDEFNTIANQLKQDLLDIIGISLSDLGERAFRLREVEEFRNYLAQLWEEAPAIVKRHLSSFEEEMRTLEASIGDLFETKYRLGAFKGVVENFVREHVMKALQELEVNFQLSLTESIQGFLATAQERFEQASAAAQQAFEELKKTLSSRLEEAMDLALGEAAHRYQESASGIAEELEQLAKSFQENFAKELDEVITIVKARARQVDQKLLETASRLSRLQEEELAPHIDKIVQKVESTIGSLARQVPKTLKQIKSSLLQTAEDQIAPLLEETEARIALASQSLDLLWRRTAESEPAVFNLYRFIQGEKEFNACLTDLLVRTRRHLLLLLPSAELIQASLLKTLKRLLPSLSVRLVVAGDKNSLGLRKLQELAAVYPNLQLRHDSRGDLWGALRDHEEILIGRTARGISSVNGISSRHEDHVALLRPLLENRWVRARPLPAIVQEVEDD